MTWWGFYFRLLCVFIYSLATFLLIFQWKLEKHRILLKRISFIYFPSPLSLCILFTRAFGLELWWKISMKMNCAVSKCIIALISFDFMVLFCWWIKIFCRGNSIYEKEISLKAFDHWKSLFDGYFNAISSKQLVSKYLIFSWFISWKPQKQDFNFVESFFSQRFSFSISWKMIFLL